ncbi:hypothetical protein B0H17DRAFT_1142646 [Mycena rosella]|uniref:Uncharacterized protein n=1 Tax=Mycena rosella TaxID=1033263 RepID=A0AAD7CWS8_MYCRO|nr:hypothetical protein B0H17DRAFT_1142646 [Mycena rosella]
MAMSDSSASESEKEQGVQIPRIFSIPNQNAGVPEYREALKTAHKLVHELAAENKSLCAQIATYNASKPGRKGRKQKSTITGENTHGYHSKIIALGKAFGVMVDPWVQSMVFSQKTAPPLAMPADIFRPDSALYPQYLTAALYAHIDTKFHDLIDTSAYPDFARNLNSQRSSGINNTKECLPMILLDEGTVPELKSDPIQRLLLQPGDDPQAKKCSNFPPILLVGAPGYIMGKRQPQNPGNPATVEQRSRIQMERSEDHISLEEFEELEAADMDSDDEGIFS